MVHVVWQILGNTTKKVEWKMSVLFFGRGTWNLNYAKIWSFYQLCDQVCGLLCWFGVNKSIPTVKMMIQSLLLQVLLSPPHPLSLFFCPSYTPDRLCLTSFELIKIVRIIIFLNSFWYLNYLLNKIETKSLYHRVRKFSAVKVELSSWI